MSRDLVVSIFTALKELGVEEIALCPGSRNAYFVQYLSKEHGFNVSTWYEERSAAFYALGTIKRSGKPAAIITTSGTAAAELLPATMEAHYLGLPLLLITADRPRRFRLSGAPQCAEQVGLYTYYTRFAEDIAWGEDSTLHKNWKKDGPAHLNVCMEDPRGQTEAPTTKEPVWAKYHNPGGIEKLEEFLDKANYPLVIASGLSSSEVEPVTRFLLKLGAPVYLEGTSRLRESTELAHLSLRIIEGIWKRASDNGYPIDAVLRIGGVPTLRPWRDLDDKEGAIGVFSVSSQPFPGLHWGDCLTMPLQNLHKVKVQSKNSVTMTCWLGSDKPLLLKREDLYYKYPSAEPSLVHHLSKHIPKEALVYLGNSLPIREWDLSASYTHPHAEVAANRGVNGIDGQLSTFFGMCEPRQPCWGIFGDLTTLYDMAAPWILQQKKDLTPICVVINNGGGMIFSRMYPEKAFLNNHSLRFNPLAELWRMEYHLWNKIPEQLPKNWGKQPTIVEIIPDDTQTKSFWEQYCQ